MKKILSWLLALSLLVVGLSSCYDVRIDERDDWKKIFEKHGFEGGFVLYDNNREIANYYNKEVSSARVNPGSTFHIFASIVGIETSTVLDENKPIYWVSKSTDSMNKESSLRDFYTSNDTLFFRNLAQQIGPERMQDYMDSVKYGNMTLSPRNYWLDGTLQITPDEQAGFMKRIYFNQLKNVSTRSSTIMQSMMLQQKDDDIQLYYQISPMTDSSGTHYWIVGFAETYNPLRNPKTELIEKKIHPFFFSGLVRNVGAGVTEEQVKNLLFDLLRDYQILK